MSKNTLNWQEIALIQKGLELLSEQYLNNIEIYEEAYDSIDAQRFEPLWSDMDRSIRTLQLLAKSCEDLSVKISNYNKEESK